MSMIRSWKWFKENFGTYEAKFIKRIEEQIPLIEKRINQLYPDLGDAKVKITRFFKRSDWRRCNDGHFILTIKTKKKPFTEEQDMKIAEKLYNEGWGFETINFNSYVFGKSKQRHQW